MTPQLRGRSRGSRVAVVGGTLGSSAQIPLNLSFFFPDTKPVVISVTTGDVEKDLESEPELGAEAAAEESHGGAGAPGPVDDENQRGGGGDGGGDEEEEEEPPQQQDEASAAAEGPQPQDPQQRLLRGLFTRLELKELESVFQRAQYPDVFAR